MGHYEYCTAWPEVEIQDGGLQTGTFNLNTYISVRGKQKNEISKPKSMFLGSTNPMQLQKMLCDLSGGEKSKMVASKTE